MAHPLIQLIDIYKKFGEKEVLSGISLSIYKGKITSIIGKSGEGKSVLLKHIIGLIESDSGTILFNNVPYSRMKKGEKKALKKKFSYMFQETALFDSMTIYENIALPLKEQYIIPPEEIKKRVEKGMHQLDLTDIGNKYPSQISGGMKKRVALARALVTEPEIVLFDEPTTGLDPIRKNAVHSMISDYQKRLGFTGVVVSHEIPDIFYISQHVAMLDKGKIIFEGSPDELQESSDATIRRFIRGVSINEDELTGMMPKPQAEKRFHEEMARMRRHRNVFSIILLTIENLYEITKMAGYEAEQTALGTFSSRVRKCLRETDICSRLGLNTIMVMLPQTDKEGAKEVCGKMAKAFSNEKFTWIKEYPGFCFSVSVGIAEAEQDKPIEALLDEAESGKNTIYELKVC